MIYKTSAAVQSYTQAKNAAGIVVKTYTSFKTMKANFQAYRLDDAQALEWGVTARRSKSRKMFYAPDPSILELFRVTTGEGTFEIKAINPFEHHYEATLVPVTV